MHTYTIYLFRRTNTGPKDIRSTSIEAESLDMAQRRAEALFEDIGPDVGADAVRVHDETGAVVWEGDDD